MDISLLILGGAGLFYLTAFLFHLKSFCGTDTRGNQAAFRWMRLGFITSSGYFVVEAARLGSFFPVADVSHAMAFFSWSLAFVYFLLIRRVPNDSFGLILTPVLLALLVAACLSFYVKSQGVPPPPNPFFTLHIASAFFAYASFTLSFSAGILFLIQQQELKAKRAGTFYHKLPSLEELENLICQPMLWGTLLLLSAIGIGFLWSKSAFGDYGIWDPKTIVTLTVACVYFLILYLRLRQRLRMKQVAILTVMAFALVLFSFVGMRFIHGSHNFLA